MPTYDVGGVPVEFPYEAYECQLTYMRAVIRALDNGENALLESPTGTGKTLCLLCATLGWRRHREARVGAQRASWEAQIDGEAPAQQLGGCPRIWYSSRTHSQLKQVVQELKRTSYKPSSVVLGSREHFCIHASVSRHSGAKQNALCKRARDENRCPFYVGLRKAGGKVKTSCCDIEEIVASCKDAGVCPFYKTREDAKEAELLLIPYDYLINPQTRESLQVSLKGSVLIFDEGHNIEKSCESAASFELKAADLALAIGEIDDAFDILQNEACSCEEALGEFTSEQLMTHLVILKKSLLALEDSIYAEKLEKDPVTERMMVKRCGNHILDIFARGSSKGDGIKPKDYKRISTVVRKAIAVLTFSMESATSGGLYLDKLQSLLATAFRAEPGELDKCYQVLIYEDTPEEGRRGAKRKAVDFFSEPSGGTAREEPPRTLCLWCFSCSVAMRELKEREVNSVLITSGTLSPLEGTAEAFGVPFPVQLENSHVIDARRQLWGGVLSTGPENVSLDASFAQRSEPAYLKDLGTAVSAMASHVPDGLLLAFQSYAMKENVLRSWRQTGLLEELSNKKPVFEEPKGHHEMQAVLDRYTAALDQKSGRGAILAAVCRGKLCEGIDFTDRQCRMVVMIGVPFPARNDLRVVAKQSFLDGRGGEGEGRRWYHREAIRAVNQTLGRVIRHKNDFGAVLLCDGRYAREDRLSALGCGISQWLRPQVSVPQSFGEALGGCRAFFARMGQAPPMPAAAAAAGLKPAAQGAAQQGGRPVPAAGKPQTSALSTVPARATSTLGLGAAVAAAAAPASGGTPLSALSSFWSRAGLRKRPPTAAGGEKAPAAEKPDRQGGSGLGAPTAAAPPARNPATPQAAAVPAGATAANSSKAGAAAQGAKEAAQPLKRATVARAPQDGLLDPEAWLRNSEALLPRMELDQVKEQMAVILEQADLIIAGTTASDTKLMTALKAVAEVLLPTFCFDTPDDERRRHALVRDCALLLPKLLRPLWRTEVTNVLKGQGQACRIW